MSPKDEPAVITGIVATIVGALISLGVQFGLNLSGDQKTAILSFIIAVTPIIVGLFIRQNVIPLSHVQPPNAIQAIPTWSSNFNTSTFTNNQMVPRGTININPAPNDPTGGSTIGSTSINPSPGTDPGHTVAPGGSTPLQQQFVPGNVVAPGGSVPLTQSFVGSSSDQLSAPAILTSRFDTNTGSTLPPGNYSYGLTTTNALGETALGPINFVVIPPGPNGEVTFTWTPDPKGTGTKVYGRGVNGQFGLIATLANNVGTYTDNGTVAPTTSPPAINTTGSPVVALGGSFNPGSTVAPGGSIPLTQGVDPTP